MSILFIFVAACALGVVFMLMEHTGIGGTMVQVHLGTAGRATAFGNSNESIVQWPEAPFLLCGLREMLLPPELSLPTCQQGLVETSQGLCRRKAVRVLWDQIYFLLKAAENWVTHGAWR